MPVRTLPRKTPVSPSSPPDPLREPSPVDPAAPSSPDSSTSSDPSTALPESLLPEQLLPEPLIVPRSRHPALPYVWMLLGSLFFAAMSHMAHAAGRQCDWQIVAMARSGLALIFAAGLVFGAKREFVFLRPPVLWMRSCAGSVSLLCGFYAVTRMPVADMLTLSNMYPLWVAVLSWPMLGALPRPGVWIAIACGLAGVVLLQQPQFAAGNYVWLIALLASFTSAIALIGLHKLQHLDARAIVVHFSGVSLLFCLGAFLFLPHSVSVFSKFDVQTLGMLLGVGLCATGGQILLTKAFAEGEPSKVAVVGLSQVGFAMLFDVILWGRTFDLITIAGILLVVLPTGWIMLRRR